MTTKEDSTTKTTVNTFSSQEKIANPERKIDSKTLPPPPDEGDIIAASQLAGKEASMAGRRSLTLDKTGEKDSTAKQRVDNSLVDIQEVSVTDPRSSASNMTGKKDFTRKQTIDDSSSPQKVLNSEIEEDNLPGTLVDGEAIASPETGKQKAETEPTSVLSESESKVETLTHPPVGGGGLPSANHPFKFFKFRNWKNRNRDSIIKATDTLLTEGRNDDIIIPIMGPTGVGKSSFINKLLGSNSAIHAGVGHDLKSFTQNLQHFVLESGQEQTHSCIPAGRRLVLLDTPGFDDTYESDSEILRRIAAWLADSYDRRMSVTGVIYLHDITQTRMFGTSIENLEMFKTLVGHAALSSVILGTTKWELLPNEEIGKDRESQLKGNYWKELINRGSEVFKAETYEESWKMISHLVEGHGKQAVILRIQKELVDYRKFIPETKAGKKLRYTLEEVLEHLQQQQSYDHDASQKISQLRQQIKGLKTSLPQQLLYLIGF